MINNNLKRMLQVQNSHQLKNNNQWLSPLLQTNNKWMMVLWNSYPAVIWIWMAWTQRVKWCNNNKWKTQIWCKCRTQTKWWWVILTWCKTLTPIKCNTWMPINRWNYKDNSKWSSNSNTKTKSEVINNKDITLTLLKPTNSSCHQNSKLK